MTKKIFLSQLLPIAIVFEGDFHQLAAFMLRGYDGIAKDKYSAARPTMHGVARAYAHLLINTYVESIETRLRDMGYDLGAVVEWDEGATDHIEASRSVTRAWKRVPPN